MLPAIDEANPERARLHSSELKRWRRWGPFLSERQWGTVREDYSDNGDAWSSFPHDHARSRAYRWGEDGLLGFSDENSLLCYATALWNGKDPILKERLYGLANPEGNHGEDVKECYYYLSATPTASYLKGLYKYPQAAFPYEQLRLENARRGKHEEEFELLDTGIFDQNRYFDVFIEYAKASPDDILIRLTFANRAPEAARLDVLPTFWFRNTWSWKGGHEQQLGMPVIRQVGPSTVLAEHKTLGRFRITAAAQIPGAESKPPHWLF